MFMITVEIQPEHAIAKGKATFGSVQMQITDTTLGQLSPYAREELTTYLNVCGTHTVLKSSYPISEPTAEELNQVLLARRDERLKAEQESAKNAAEAKAKWLTELRSTITSCLDNPETLLVKSGKFFCVNTGKLYLYSSQLPDVPITWLADIERAKAKADALMRARNDVVNQELEAAAAERDKRNEENKARTLELVQRRGTESQLERFQANLLPKNELKTLIREELFSAIDSGGFTRRTKLRKSDARHAEHDPDQEYHTVSFGVDGEEDIDGLPAEHWAKLKELKLFCEANAINVDIELRAHWVVCDEPKCPARCFRYGALVTANFNEEEYSREYHLGHDVNE